MSNQMRRALSEMVSKRSSSFLYFYTLSNTKIIAELMSLCIILRYHVPRGWLNPSGNLLVVFEEWGGEPTKIALVQRATSSVCADIFEGQPTLQSSQKLASAKLIKAKAHLRCQPGQIISDIKFASYGWPQGTCGSFKEGSCHAHKSYDFPRMVCIGKQFCTIPVAPAYFGGDPCPGSAKKFSVEAVCS